MLSAHAVTSGGRAEASPGDSPGYEGWYSVTRRRLPPRHHCILGQRIEDHEWRSHVRTRTHRVVSASLGHTPKLLYAAQGHGRLTLAIASVRGMLSGRTKRVDGALAEGSPATLPAASKEI